MLALAGQGGGKIGFQCTPSWGGSWALLAFILPHIFAFVFKIDFPWIVCPFWRDLGRILGGHNRRKIEILGVWGDMMPKKLILVEFCLIFDEIAGEKHISFWLFLVSFLAFVLTFETFKIVLPSRREVKFYKIAFFALDEKRR